ncbi:PhoD-like phosphatase [Grimontia celer]|uniref:PhoD-like phosphatase n=1 Tax=Grimontia celer TaxID=1796497 RepID=A0A128F3L5_9GAMM|nr:alkaline phosphatase D family protein [Grimontia celer]CZF81383.1 PhoD-like phosphatase [Grimontia celer]
MALPVFLAGPILRRTTQDEVCIWAITSEPLTADFLLYQPEQNEAFYQANFAEQKQVQLGDHCFVVMAQFSADAHFEIDRPFQYDIIRDGHSLLSPLDAFLYEDESRPTFVIPSKAEHIAHGSCRHPHHHCEDALAALDTSYEETPVEKRADLLIMSGDQIYADDVCGPLMSAIRQTINLLGMNDQEFEGADIRFCSELSPDKTPYYSRTELLPFSDINHGLIKRLCKAKPEPVFSSRTTENHLISLNEFIAMYALVWSPALWQHIELEQSIQSLSAELQKRWDIELAELARFRTGLVHLRRLFAHIPTYMIFDDHDVTDDYNLTVGWERAVNNSPFAQGIITNAMIGYFFCQGWGNQPKAFTQDFWTPLQAFLDSPDPANLYAMTQVIHHFEQWHYTIPTTPKVVVIDTRTRRWRSESSYNKPSGLMDWESLMDFQQDVFNNDAVVVVSPAPMFGVKFIETIQRIVTFMGHPLATDSENWMAHPGSANALLNIFKHPKTPKNFVILSGDVHYSFAYDIRMRFRKSSPRIWQITCSGFRNQFPEPFLSIFEWLDRKLFWPESPLNVFTRRKRMRIERRRPDNGNPGLLVNQSAVGIVKLNHDGAPKYIGLLTGKGERVAFHPCEETDKEEEFASADLSR